MRISDWSSDVCSSDLDNVSPPRRTRGCAGEVAREVRRQRAGTGTRHRHGAMNCPGERDITPTLKGAWKWTCSQPATQTPCYSPLRSWHHRRLATDRHTRTHPGRLPAPRNPGRAQNLQRGSTTEEGREG